MSLQEGEEAPESPSGGKGEEGGEEGDAEVDEVPEEIEDIELAHNELRETGTTSSIEMATDPGTDAEFLGASAYLTGSSVVREFITH